MDTAELVNDVERAVGFVDKSRDEDIYRLVTRLKDALQRNDLSALLKTARDIADHAENRYEAVIAQADRLVRHLEDRR